MNNGRYLEFNQVINKADNSDWTQKEIQELAEAMQAIMNGKGYTVAGTALVYDLEEEAKEESRVVADKSYDGNLGEQPE